MNLKKKNVRLLTLMLLAPTAATNLAAHVRQKPERPMIIC